VSSQFQSNQLDQTTRKKSKKYLILCVLIKQLIQKIIYFYKLIYIYDIPINIFPTDKSLVQWCETYQPTSETLP